MDSPKTQTIERGTYRHTKSGKLYRVLGVALETETNERLVIYEPLYECEHDFFARPYEMFIESITVNGQFRPRFVKIDKE